MQVADVLAALRPAVDREPVAALAEAHRLADAPGGEDQPPDQGRVTGLERQHRLDVAPGDDQQMDGRLRIDVAKREDLVVLVLDVGGTLPRRDPTEETGRGGGQSMRSSRSPRISQKTRTMSGSSWPVRDPSTRMRSASASSSGGL